MLILSHTARKGKRLRCSRMDGLLRGRRGAEIYRKALPGKIRPFLTAPDGYNGEDGQFSGIPAFIRLIFYEKETSR